MGDERVSEDVYKYLLVKPFTFLNAHHLRPHPPHHLIFDQQSKPTKATKLTSTSHILNLYKRM